MIFFKALKYKIIEYCLEVIFDKLNINFLSKGTMIPFTKVPLLNAKFAHLFHEPSGYHFYDCLVVATGTGPDVPDSYDSVDLYCEKRSSEPKNPPINIMAYRTFTIHELNLTEWYQII